MTRTGAVATIRRLPIVAGSYDGIDGDRAWEGSDGDERLIRIARTLAADLGSADILHLDARDTMTSVALGQTARSRGGAVLAVDDWVPGPADWTAEPGSARDLPLRDRARALFLHAIVRERLTRFVTPLVADASALHAIARSRGLVFDLVVWSAGRRYRSHDVALADADLLLDLLSARGALAASLPAGRGFDEQVARWAERVAGHWVRVADVLVAARTPMPAGMVAKQGRRTPAPARRLRGDPVLRAADIRVEPDALAASPKAALVSLEASVPMVPRIVLAEDWTGTGAVGRDLFTHVPTAGIELFVARGGICGVERRMAASETLALSLADADGRPLADDAPRDAPAMNDRLQARGIIDFAGGDTLVRMPAPTHRLDGTVFAAASFDNYFHWHNDVLGWLPYVQDLADRLGGGPLRLVAPFKLTSWRRRSLELFGIDPGRYTELAPGHSVQATELLIAQPRHSTATPRRAGEAFARIRDALGAPAAGDGRIWISRADVGTREVANEEALRPELEGRGFRIAALGRLDYDEKVRMFAGASLAVGPHGAGFTHAGFMHPGGVIAEIFTDARVRRYIPRLAAAYGLGYGYMCVPYRRNKARSFHVDPQLLLPALDRLIAAQAAGV